MIQLNQKFLLLSFISIVLISFSKLDNSDIQNIQSENNFYPLIVGNSWVDKNYPYNSNNQAYDYNGVVDSISIVGTQSFSGVSYFIFRRLTTCNDTEITFYYPNGEFFLNFG